MYAIMTCAETASARESDPRLWTDSDFVIELVIYYPKEKFIKQGNTLASIVCGLL